MPVDDATTRDEELHEERLGRLLGRLPQRLQSGVAWLREPSRVWIRIPAGILLIVGSLFSILPVFGLWMLPLGLVLLAEDVGPLRRAVGRVLAWIERRHPSWMGLPPTPQPGASRR
jgi:hypothetical protein